jgi:hypothetical protein
LVLLRGILSLIALTVGITSAQTVGASENSLVDATATSAPSSTPPIGLAPQDANPVPTVVFDPGTNFARYVDGSDDIPARTVYFELAEVNTAVAYEVQVRPYKHKWAEPFKTRTTRTNLRLRLAPGHYAIRTRSVGESKHVSDWGQWKDFHVHFKPPIEVTPANDSLLAPKGNQAERITFEWPSIATAKFYHLKLKDQDGQILDSIITKQTWHAAEVAVDRSYAWSIIPLLSRDDAGADGIEEIWNHFRVDKPNDTLRSLLFQIDPVAEAKSYQFEFSKFIGDDEIGDPSVYDTFTPDYRVRLGPGRYELRVRTVYDNNLKSAWSPPETFFVEIPNPTLISPRQGELVDPKDEEAPVLLKWASIKEAYSFKVKVYKEDGTLVVNQETRKSSLLVNLDHSTTYHWEVTAYNRGEADRSPASINLPSASFSLDSYIKLELSSAEEPSQLYGWTRHISSMVDYGADNFDNGTRLEQSMFGGTGELAIGYWHRKTDYGLLATGAISGFTIGNQTFLYGGGSLLVGRRVKLPGNQRLRLWAGLAYKETPEIQSNYFDPEFMFDKVGAIGPEFRASYMWDIDRDWGGQLHVNANYGLISVEAPKNSMFDQFSYSLGVAGTKRLSDQMIGLIGYTYQSESGSYRSDDLTRGINRISLSGHFLSLTIQFGLEPPVK